MAGGEFRQYVMFNDQSNDNPDSSDDEGMENHWGPWDYPVTRTENWTDWYSSDLWNMWRLIEDYSRANGISANVLRYANFTDFCEWCHSMSDQACGHATNYP